MATRQAILAGVLAACCCASAVAAAQSPMEKGRLGLALSEVLALVDFTEPWIAGVDEIVVTGPAAEPVGNVDALSGRSVFVRPSSSYYQGLVALNARFESEGRTPVTLTPAPEELEDEDLLEMANAGLVDALVVDNHKAWFWQRVWPRLRLYPAAALRTGGEIAWAVRKDSPRGRHARA